MDAYNVSTRQRPHPRAPSRSSTHTSASRVTPTSANSSSSYVVTSPQLSHSHSPHRHYQKRGSVSSPRPMSRPTPPLSRKDSVESTRQPALSSFLQERLQQERRAESEKMTQSHPSLSRSFSDMCHSNELGRTPSSPQKNHASEIGRSQSSMEVKQGNKKGLGVKEMEQVISKLHKQNFDLKLELYHRRERQTTLEERLDALEGDRQRAEQVGNKMLIELEKRDKAVEEAVAMIVGLEAKVDQLIHERTILQQIERTGLFCAREGDMTYKTPIPQGFGPDISKMEDGVKSVDRMPSFLSELSEATENLRNVYFGERANSMNLPQVEEDFPGPDKIQAMGSPTLSVLSEGSFASVYGQHVNGVAEDAATTPVLKATMTASKGEGRTRLFRGGKTRSRSCSKTNGSVGKFQITRDIITESPLQRLEQLDVACKDGQGDLSHVADNRLIGSRNARQVKRDDLRKVLTDGAGGARLHDRALPPTPDTISTSTLQHLQCSSEALPRTIDHSEYASNGVPLVSGEHGVALQVNSTTPAATDRKDLDSWASPSSSSSKPNVGSLFQHSGPVMGRPQSADGSTISLSKARAWDSGEEESDDASDARSLLSSLDIWMREGARPSKRRTRDSPDLFGFPCDAQKNWTAASMFATGSNPAADGLKSSSFGYMQDLFAPREGLLASGAAPPPPPDRRSSLHAKLESSEATSRSVDHCQTDDKVASSTSRRQRVCSSRQGSVDLDCRDNMRTPVQRDQYESPSPAHNEQKSKHYPPIAGQQSSGARAGLNRLFRRSTGNSSSAPVLEPLHSKSAVPDTAKNQPVNEATPWTRIHTVEDDRSGATPPPILFNPRQTRRSMTGAEDEPGRQAAPDTGHSKNPSVAGTTSSAVATVPEPQTGPAESSPAVSSGIAARMKWLPGLSRAINSKNRSG